MELEIKLVALPGEPLEPRRVLDAVADLGRLLAEPQLHRLVAAYHDSTDGLLRAARWTLRSRDEGSGHVATTKGPGPLIGGMRSRVEVETPLERPAEPGDPLPPALADALRGAGLDVERWPPRTFASDVRRTAAQLELAGGTTVELAIDHGEVVAGSRSWPVRELEIELVAGEPAPLLEATLQLARRLAVRPGGRSKAARGMFLLGLLAPPSLPAADATPTDAWEALCELEERRLEGDHSLRDEHDRLRRQLGIEATPDGNRWVEALWTTMGRVARSAIG
jgi:triphosphatase